MSLEKLFEPGRIGGMALKNRIVMAPLGHFSANQGRAEDRTVRYYEERARGGAGFLITGGSSVRPGALVPLMLWIHEDEYIDDLKRIPEAVHPHGAKIAVQLNDFGKNLSFPGWRAENLDLIGPSPVPWLPTMFRPREATQEDIDHLVESFAQASLRVKRAGFDAVEIHGAHGYTVGDFLSPHANRRTDRYGGSPEKRARFVCELLRRARELVGADFPICLRISADDYLAGGINLEDTLRQAPLLVEAGADALHISASAAETTEWQFLTYPYRDGEIVHLAEAFKKKVNVPVITVGKIHTPFFADRLLREGRADFVAFGRPLMADPDMPRKALEGRYKEIRQCIYCNNCMGYLYKTVTGDREGFNGLRCTVNPALIREAEFELQPAQSPKKVMVVGAGLAGMEAARVLAERGHRVSLYEKADESGGQWNIVCKQKGKERYATVTHRLVRGLDQAGVEMVLSREATPELVRSIAPDAVVVATGAVPLTPDIPGMDLPGVVRMNDVILGRAQVGERVVILGGDVPAMETAWQLAEQGRHVSIVSDRAMGEGDSQDKLDPNLYRTLLRKLIDLGVYMYPHCLVYEIRDEVVHLNYNFNLVYLKRNTVVLAPGRRSVNTLAEGLQGVVPEVYAIGDCVSPRDAMEAIREGALIGRKI